MFFKICLEKTNSQETIHIVMMVDLDLNIHYYS